MSDTGVKGKMQLHSVSQQKSFVLTYHNGEPYDAKAVLRPKQIFFHMDHLERHNYLISPMLLLNETLLE